MIENSGIAISTSAVLLVPYEERHVETYHLWMLNTEIQTATASEPLSIEQEYAMQRSWRQDHDKLTFIACLPCQPFQRNNDKIISGTFDGPEQMIGDVNLFLTLSDVNPKRVIGEIELMIAPAAHRRRGYGRVAVLVLCHYVCRHLDRIMAHYSNGHSLGEEVLWSHFRVKIDAYNWKSIALFKSIGFSDSGDDPNYFGELELTLKELNSQKTKELLETFCVQDYAELPYCDPKEQLPKVKN